MHSSNSYRIQHLFSYAKLPDCGMHLVLPRARHYRVSYRILPTLQSRHLKCRKKIEDKMTRKLIKTPASVVDFMYMRSVILHQMPHKEAAHFEF